MANVKISQLPSLSTMTDSAIIPVVASDATQQISGENLKTYFSSVTGNIYAGNVLTSGEVIASGVIQSGTGLSTGGYLSVNGSTDLHDTTVTGNISAGTVTTPELTVNIIKSDDSTIVVVQDGLEVDGDAVVNGNITANYLFGNGSQLTGLAATYGNANVVTLLAGFGSNTIVTTGNITANAFIGDGSQLTNLPSGTGGITFEYAIGNFTANALPLPGTMQFTNRDGEVVAPDLGTKLWISANDSTGLITGSTWLAMAQNSERGIMTLQQSTSQIPFRVTNVGTYSNPEVYRGYHAGVNQIWGDDPSINQIIITNATAPVFYNENFNIADDVFHATNLADATAVYMVNVYGSDRYTPLSQNELWSFFVNFVDNVIYQNTNTETFDVTEIRTAFYTNFNNFYNSISTLAYDQNFQFTNNTTYYPSAPVTTEGLGVDGRLRVRLNVDYTYTIMGISAPGTGYQFDDVIVVDGEDIGGISLTNDITLSVSGVDGAGGITAVVINSGVSAYPWRSNSISDGGDDQYDTANRINTNLAQGILYAGGNVTAGTTTFGADSNYAVMYNTSVFCMAATGVDITDLYYSGNLGADGDGFLRWSGLRNSTSDGYDVQYAYMTCELGTGDLEPQVGETYQVGLDSAGINFDGFYSNLNDANGEWYFGADRDWTLESRAQLVVQSYNTLILQTVRPVEAAGTNSPNIDISTDTGSDGNAQFNQQAGAGGSISITAGSAGTNNSVPGLGNNGGDIAIIAGDATGNGQVGGGVLIEAGSGAFGTASNVTLRTRSGATANGAIVLETSTVDNTNFWQFKSDGAVTFPTLSVDLHNGGVQSAQTLQFGDAAQQAIITGPTSATNVNAQRLIIQGQRGLGTGEGGDVYVWAGDTDGVNGGDIKIYAGDADDAAAGSGGYVNIDGGAGFDNGGLVEITGGYSSNGLGGAVNIIGGGSSNGNSNSGNVHIVSSSSQWVFANDGKLTFPGTPRIDTDANNFEVQAAETISLEANAVVNIYTDTSGNAWQWQFGSDGNLTLPGNTFAVNYANGTPVSIGGGSGNTGNVTFDDNIVIGTGDEFGFSGLYLAVGPDSIANSAVQYLRVRGGDAPTHIHLDTGNNQYYDQYFGDDGKFVRLDAGDFGNVTIGTQNPGNSYIWTFDSAGNTIVPGNIQSITTGFPFTSDISGINTGSPTVLVTLTDAVFGAPETGQVTISSVVGTIEANNTWYYLSIDPSNFQLYYDSALQNPVDGTGWTTYVSGGSAVAQGYNDISIIGGNVNIVTNTGNTWTFDSDGRLTFPGTPRIDTDSDNFEIQAAENISLEANAVVNIYTDSSGNTYQWQFGDDGSLTLPIGVSIDASVDPQYPKIIADSGKLFSVQGQGNTGSAAMAWSVNPNAASQYAAVSVSRGGGDDLAKVVLQAQSDSGNVATAKTWQFSETGNLTLPGNLVITGNANVFGIDAALIQQTDGLPIVISSSGANGAVATYWVEDYANASTSNIAAVYVRPTLGANIVRIAVGQNGVGSGPNLWDFDAVGTLTLPGGSRLRPLGANLDIFAGAGSYVNLITTDESTSVGVDGGGGYITTAGGTWDFDTTGNLTVPGNIIMTTGIVGSGASPAPYLSGFSSLSAVTLNASGNITGNTAGFAIGYRDIPQVAFTANSTITTTDAGKHYYSTQSSNFTLTIANNASQGFQVGAAITVVNQGTGTITVAQGSGVTLYIAGNATSGNRSVATFGMATIMKVATNTWFINGTGVS